MANWSWQLTDSGFNPVGELVNAKEMKLSLPLNKINTASFNVRLDHPLASNLSTDLGYLKIYREKSLLFFGPLITVAEVGEGDNATMQVNASGPEWIFSQRLCGRGATGTKLVGSEPRSAKFVVQLAARNTDGETHIDYTTGPISGGSTAIYETTPYRTLAEQLNDMSNTAEGFDWEVYPIENFEDGVVTGTKIGRLVTANEITIEQPSTVFEWGAGRNNIASFTRNIDRSTMTNRAWNISAAGPEAPGAPTVSAESAESIAKYGLQEALISAAILNTTLRQLLVNENIEVRKNPRQTIVFQPVIDNGSGRVPVLGKDYKVGDTVRVRLVLNGSPHFDAMVRVWGAEYALDENLKETQVLTLSNTV
jgi:hypothetical protein